MKTRIINTLEIVPMEEIYSPEEDSYLLSSVIEKELKTLREKDKSNFKFLDMGSGSGIQSETAIKSGIQKGNVTAVDINETAISLLKKKLSGSQVVFSNLFSEIDENETFDLIAFNPPYLPEIKYDKEKDTSSGKLGSETLNLFLERADKFLSEKGKILVLVSTFTKGINWFPKIYTKKKIASKKLFFEELYVFELKRKKS